jgi:hypothetical protein
MKALTIALTILGLSLAGCNAVGPYTAKVYRLDGSVFMVNVSTWLGSDKGWPRGNEKLKRTAESVVKRELANRGFHVEACAFMKFTPQQGGHMVIVLVAGEGLAVGKWAAMTEEEFYAELRKRPPQPEVLQFEGRIENP